MLSATGAGAIRVVVIEYSPGVRRWMCSLLEAEGLTVVGEAADARSGRDRIVELDPNVVVLDLEMPGLHGTILLRAIQRFAPRPVVALSSATPGSAEEAAAFEAGATHVLARPRGHTAIAFAGELIHRVRQAAAARIRFPRESRPGTDARTSGPIATAAGGDLRFAGGQLVAIGASTGGPGALREVLAALPRHGPPIAIVQHIPPVPPSSLPERLRAMLDRNVAAAHDGEPLTDGMIRLAPADRHLTVEWDGRRFVTRTRLDAPACALRPGTSRPSVDVLFHSVAMAAGSRAVGVVLTGMGDDGAAGLSAMRAAGATTIAQDEATSVVFGMPRAAIARGGATTVAPLDRVAATIIRSLQRSPSRAA